MAFFAVKKLRGAAEDACADGTAGGINCAREMVQA
jgi:hypothetical protein